MREIKEKLYYIVHINYSVDTAYIFSYRKTRVFTTNQAWAFIEDISNASKIEGHLVINSRSIREVKDYLEKSYLANCNFDNTKTIFLITNVVSDEDGNDIIDYTDSERKYEEELELLLDESLQFGEAPEEINDSAAIQQEQSDSEKELIKEDFVSFEKELEEHKFLIIPFENEFKLTEELISIKGQAICDEYESEYCFDDLKLVFLDFLIYEFFPNSKIRLEEDKKSLHVETRLGTVFILRPVDWENRRCEYRYLHKYDISLCIF